MLDRNQYQLGYYLRKLKEFIASVVGVEIADKMSATTGTIQLDLSPKHHGLGLDILTQKYIAKFLFEDFPVEQFNPADLLANVAAWLMDNDQSRKKYNLDHPTVGIITTSEDTAEISIDIDFVEPIMVVPSKNGNILWRGKSYKIASYDIWTAKNINIDIGIKR